ncbi:MAG: hypothetical protein OIN66_07015 [Candidatus Methanoperedens sp.]|nr:hypothetical protein [Candidatus Methanoperedens sp.]
MINKRTGLIIAGLMIVFASIYLSLPALFLVLLLGSLLIPPAFVFSLMLVESIPVTIKLSQNLLAGEKPFFVISISKESIILEPEFR